MLSRTQTLSGTRQANPAARSGLTVARPTVPHAVATLLETQTSTRTSYTPRPYVEPVNAEQLNKRLESKAKALIALEEQAIPTRPIIRICFRKQVGLGDAWKVVGRVPELGRFIPEVAPYMTWTEGHNWSFEGHIRPGTWLFKLVLRTADGKYIWEEGPDRVMVVPEPEGEGEIYEMVIDEILLPPP